MRLVRLSVSIVLMATVLVLGAAVGAQDDPRPELISEDGNAEAPPRSDQPAYTQYLVRQAIERYEAHGRDATIEYFKDPAVVDGLWYVFIVSADGILISHPTRPDLIGTSTAARRDVFGKAYGQEIVAATSDGRWVDYYFTHPESGEPAQKHSWVVHHDGLFFGSGWYDVDEADAPPKIARRAYTRYLVDQAIDRYDTEGREHTVAYHNTPGSLDGQWYVFIIDSDGIEIANANRPDVVGEDIATAVDVNGKTYGLDIAAATEDGGWVDYVFTNPETGGDAQKYSWVIRHDGLIFGSGWYDTGEVPPQSDVAGYTQYLVNEAIERYESTGRDATLDHYNDPVTVDGQWYVFIISEEERIIANANRADVVGVDAAGLVDVNGKPYGVDVVAADESGTWVDYYFTNPETGEDAHKYTWIIRHDGLLFGSGWYTVPEPPADEMADETGPAQDTATG